MTDDEQRTDAAVTETGRVQARSTTDTEWLDAMFAQPERDLAELPEWARPVVTPPDGQDR